MSVIDNVYYRKQGLAHEVLQWFICRMEAWFAADADMISLKSWDQASVNVLVWEFCREGKMRDFGGGE